MTTHELKRLFPNASTSTITANCGVVQDAERQRGAGDEPVGEDASESGHQGRCLVRVTSYRCRLCDQRNLFDKHFVDALVEAGVLRGDSEADIDIEVVQQRVEHAWDERTEIDISDARL